MSTADIPLKDNYAVLDDLPSVDVNTIAKMINACNPIGKITAFFGRSADVPSGQLICDGATIGNASSGAATRANDDMEDLFKHLWEIGNADATLDIFDSGGSASTYGANSQADWEANKRIALPDLRGRVIAGMDDQGGSGAGTVTDAEADKVGGEFGAETHTLTEAELASHSHTFGTVWYANGGGSGGNFNVAGGAISPVNDPIMDDAGSDEAHNNMQPTIFAHMLIWSGTTW